MNLRAEFFDIFGTVVFLFIIAISSWALKTGKAIPQWALIILLIIGVLGLLVDSIIVKRTYLNKK